MRNHVIPILIRSYIQLVCASLADIVLPWQDEKPTFS